MSEKKGEKEKQEEVKYKQKGRGKRMIEDKIKRQKIKRERRTEKN